MPRYKSTLPKWLSRCMISRYALQGLQEPPLTVAVCIFDKSMAAASKFLLYAESILTGLWKGVGSCRYLQLRATSTRVRTKWQSVNSIAAKSSSEDFQLSRAKPTLNAVDLAHTHTLMQNWHTRLQNLVHPVGNTRRCVYYQCLTYVKCVCVVHYQTVTFNRCMHESLHHG